MLSKKSAKPIFLFLALFIFKNIGAQIKSLTIIPSVYKYGDVSNWKNPPATYTIANNSDKPLVFLPTFPAEDILVELPIKPISKGESDIIKVTYFTSLPGTFQKEIKVYVNISDQPLILKIEGDILSISPDAQISCPTFSNKTFAQQQSFQQEVLIIDAETKTIIPDVNVRILGNESEYESVSNNKGIAESKIIVGLHDILVSKKGYHNELRIFYLNKTSGLLTIELRKDSTYKESDILTNNEKNNDTTVKTLVTKTKENEIKANVLSPNLTIKNEPVLAAEKYNPNNIVFLIDASSSMKSNDKLPLLKKSMTELLEVLRGIDKLSMVTYAATASIIVSGITADKKQFIGSKIDSLQTKGWTNGVKGIETAYALAEKNYVFNGNNQLILATDGLFNNPNYDEQALINLIKREANKGIKLSIIGFGDDGKAHRLMKKLAFVGEGNFIQIKNTDDSGAILIEEIKINSEK